HLASMSFGLLVLALRRGGKLATAMEARGFARPIPGGGRRTWARESRLVATDWWVMLAGVILASLPVLVSVTTDSWRFLGLQKVRVDFARNFLQESICTPSME